MATLLQITKRVLNFITASCVKTCVLVFRVRFHFLKQQRF